MVVVVGAGLAGLLAANMLKSRYDVRVVERQASLPNNHSAVLRFRTPLVSEVLGIPFRKVTVIKGTEPWKNPIADALAYSRKNTGEYRSDRSVNSSSGVVERWIAPPDLIAQMAKGINIEYSANFEYASEADSIISTIPMPSLMETLAYPRKNVIDFNAYPGINVRAKVFACDAYVSLAVPDPAYPFSRVSITGDELIVECPGRTLDLNDDMARGIAVNAAYMLGITENLLSDISWKKQQYAKIIPIDETERRRFLHWCSSDKGYCFNLGRFATWRPGLLMDDLVNDVRVITKFMQSKSSAYDSEMFYTRKA